MELISGNWLALLYFLLAFLFFLMECHEFFSSRQRYILLAAAVAGLHNLKSAKICALPYFGIMAQGFLGILQAVQWFVYTPQNIVLNPIESPLIPTDFNGLRLP